MRTILTPLALMLLLTACSNAPQDAAKPAAAPTPAPAAPAPKTEQAAAPAPAPAAPAELPVGACGDQSAVAKEERLANTPRAV